MRSWGYYKLDVVGGDVVTGKFEQAQPLHHNYASATGLGWVAAISCALRTCSPLNGALTIVPRHGTEEIQPTLHAGDVLLRDVNVWHRGAANFSSIDRVLPCVRVVS